MKMTLTRHVTAKALRRARIINENEIIKGAKKVRTANGNYILELITEFVIDDVDTKHPGESTGIEKTGGETGADSNGHLMVDVGRRTSIEEPSWNKPYGPT